MADPWLDWGWFKIGPFTPTQEDRVAAERRYEELRQEEGRQRAANRRDREGIPALVNRPRRPVTLTPEQKAASEAAQPPAQPATVDIPPRQFPNNLDQWSIHDHLFAPYEEYTRAKGEKAREDNRQAAADRRDMEGPPIPGQPQAAPAVAETPPTLPPQETGQPAQPTLTPQQQMIEDIKRQRAMIDEIYPQRSMENPAQTEADAYAEKERERANALAQLAFFSGVTQGAGGSWEGVGKGFAAAGQAHSQGFDRYQRALQAKATRMSDQNDLRYQDEAARAGAAVKLYEGEQDLKKAAITDNRQRQKERRDAIDDYFKKRLDLAEGNEFAPTDQSMVERIMKDWRISRDRDEIIDTTDVRDPAAPSS